MAIAGLRCPMGAPYEEGSAHTWRHCIHECPAPCRPRPIIAAMAEDQANDDHGDGVISISSLVGGCSWEWLQGQGKCYVPVKRLEAISRGQAVHQWIERGGGNLGKQWMIEERFAWQLTIDGKIVPISGRVDAYDRKEGVLYDWKTIAAKSVKYGLPKPDHSLQLNGYRWLLEKWSLPVKEIRVAYWHDYGIDTYPVSFMSLQEVEAQLTDRANLLFRMWNGTLPMIDVEPEGPGMYGGKKCSQYCHVSETCPVMTVTI